MAYVCWVKYRGRIHATRYGAFSWNGLGFPPPKTAPLERKPLGAKHGCLVRTSGQISAPRPRRIKCFPMQFF